MTLAEQRGLRLKALKDVRPSPFALEIAFDTLTLSFFSLLYLLQIGPENPREKEECFICEVEGTGKRL